MFKVKINGRTFLLKEYEFFRLLEKLPLGQTIDVVDILKGVSHAYSK